MIAAVVLALVGAYAFSCTASWLCRERFRMPLLQVVEKRGWFWGLLRLLYRPFGDLYEYDTTIGNICGVPVGRRLGTKAIRHETTHAAWFAALGWGNVWVGLPAVAVLYFVLPLPVGLAWFRWRFERAAYLADGTPASQLAEHIGGRAYGWCWPRAWMR